MQTKPSNNQVENYGKDAVVTMKITERKIKGLIVKEGERVHAERAQFERQSQMKNPSRQHVPTWK